MTPVGPVLSRQARCGGSTPSLGAILDKDQSIILPRSWLGSKSAKLTNGLTCREILQMRPNRDKIYFPVIRDTRFSGDVGDKFDKLINSLSRDQLHVKNNY